MTNEVTTTTKRRMVPTVAAIMPGPVTQELSGKQHQKELLRPQTELMCMQ